MLSSAGQSEIRALVEAKDFAMLKAAVSSMEMHDLTGLLERLEGEELAVVFRLLPQQLAADTFGDLPLERQEELLSMLSSEKVAVVLSDMPPDERTELLEELPGTLAQRLLSSLRGEELKIARSLLAYPADSIGRLMTPEYLSVHADWTVEQVLQHIRQVGPATETLNVMYVVDEKGKLLDGLSLEQLVLAEPDVALRDLMDNQVPALQASEDREAAVDDFKKYDAVALPVVDGAGSLVGIVTVDDVLDVAEEENTEDFQKMAGMAALEYSYFGTGYLEMLRKRLPWLMMLLMAQMLTTLALLGFDKLPLFAVLVVFMPLINSPAGNTGSQVAGLMIRGLAVQEIALGDWRGVLLRELLRGLTLGLALAVVGFIAVRIFCSFVEAASAEVHINPTQIALAVSLAISVAVTLANLVGSMLPFCFKRFGLDPAVTSGPFIASLMDVSGIVIYFSIATTLLSVLG